MENAPTPQEIKDRAVAAHVSINRLMMAAGIQNSTFWRWETGKTDAPHPVTLRKITDALEGFERERAA